MIEVGWGTQSALAMYIARAPWSMFFSFLFFPSIHQAILIPERTCHGFFTTLTRSIVIKRPYNKRNAFRVRKNNQIRVPEVRVIGNNGEQMGVMTSRNAFDIARKQGLDLVEISPTAKPPVCRITEYGKFRYEQDKKKKQAKKNQVVVKLKELKYHANVEEHDYQTKLRHAYDFIEHGNRIKCSLYFRGRENTHHELGYELFERIIEDLKEIAQVDQKPTLAGRSLIMMLSPDKKS